MLAGAGLRLEAALRLLRPWRGVLGSDRIGRRLRAVAAIHVARRPQRAWPPCWSLRGPRGSYPRGPGVRWVGEGQV